ncbi:MAG: HDOD domain-containing protein [Verrucomicrobia bacterium]|nr:HDOD domain-containing protein [Verrucomicrobiota bacterium]
MTVALPITREKIVESARTLPAAPQVLGGLCELLQDVNADLDQVANQIRLDAALASRVVRISNSAVFGMGARIGSVEEAVNRVGFGEVLRLVGVATVARLVDRELACYCVDAERLRESLLMHALASEALARHTDIDSRTAYTAGLLRALGLMVLDRVARGRLPANECFNPQRYGSYVEWEGANFGLSHPEVTTMILDEWRFDDAVVEAIQEHLLLRGSGTDNRFACLLNVAGSIVERFDFALPGETTHWALSPEKLAAAGFEAEFVDQAAQEAHTLFIRQRAALY